jgi:hypothetical protein
MNQVIEQSPLYELIKSGLLAEGFTAVMLDTSIESRRQGMIAIDAVYHSAYYDKVVYVHTPISPALFSEQDVKVADGIIQGIIHARAAIESGDMYVRAFGDEEATG